ncbi:MAG: hypothetical protein WBC06_00655 [Chitinophagaceae bacterium]
MTNRRTRRFWKSVFILFLIYLLVTPLIYIAMDYASVEKSFKSKPVIFILQMMGISFVIAVILSAWTRRDPELRKW